MNFACESCGHTPESSVCAQCSEQVPLWAKYCPFCGESLMAASAPVEGDPFSMENRRLCPDGNCIGILDAGGRCVVCGKNG